MNVSVISLPSLCFEEASNCTDIVLRENNLTTIEADAWMGLDNLDSLTIEDNRLQSIPRGAFEHLTNLTFLSLNRNDIQAIEQGAWLHLDTLDYLGFRGNRLSAITANMFTHLQSLTHIELRDNNIRRIEAGAWFGLGSLYSLDLSYNELTAIHTQMFRPIQETGNGLNSVFSSGETGFNTSALYELHLDNNQISEIESGAFSELTGLNYLSLSNNNLGSLKQHTFEGLVRNYFTLDLSNNNLRTIQWNVFDPALNVGKLWIF